MLRAAVALLLLTALVVPNAAAEWSSFRGDSRNSATVPLSSYSVFEEVWWNNKTLNNAQVKASPVLKDQILITASLGGVATDSRGRTTTTPGLVRALDGESGKELWRHQMTGAIYSTPAISGERVYVADMKGVLRALNLRSGEVEHENRAIGGGGTQAPITLHEGKLFVGTEDGRMMAFLSSTLTLLWEFEQDDRRYGRVSVIEDDEVDCEQPFSPQPIRSGVAVFDGKVFFGSMNHYIFALDEHGNGDQTTDIMWSGKAQDIIVGAPTIYIESTTIQRVIVGAYDGRIYSFNPSPSGEGSDPCFGGAFQLQWFFEVPSIVDVSTGEKQISKVHSSPASSGGRVYFGANNGHVYAISATDGKLVWENKTTGNFIEPVTSSPVVANGIVVVGSENKNVYWLDAVTGAVLASFPTIGAIQTSPAIDGVRAYVASQDGTIYMFGPEIPKRPDLQVQSIKGVAAGIEVKILNAGDAASTPTAVRLEIGGEYLGSIDLPAIQPGATSTVTLPHELPEGRSSVKAVVDEEGAVAESVEANNEKTQNVQPVEPVDDGGDGDGDGGGGGIKIPAPGLVPLLALLALAVLALRRRR